MSKYLRFLIFPLLFLFLIPTTANAKSVNNVSYGVNYYRYNTTPTGPTTNGTFNFATTGTLPIYPISGYKNNYSSFAWYGIDFLSDSPVNGSAIGYKITATFKISMDGLVSNIGSTAFTGFVHFNNGTIKDEVSSVEVIGLESGSGTFKITSVVTLTNETNLSGLTYSLRANSSIGSAPYGNTIYTQLSLLDTSVELTNDLNSAILNSINSNQQITNDKLNEVKEEQNKTNQILTDDTIDDNIKFNTDDLTDESGIQDLLLMPLTLMNAVNNGFNSSCSPFSLGSLYGHDLSLQCFTISDIVGSSLSGIIDVLISGMFIYAFSKHLRKVFDRTTNLENEEGDVI